MSLSQFKLYLPKYLSPESQEMLFDGLKDFPSNIDSRLYTDFLQENVIYQGDGINGLLAFDYNLKETKTISAIVLSNTCDIEISNNRLFKSQIVYAPIINLAKYEASLSVACPKGKIDEHIKAIRKQRITQIFYLPKFEDIIEESIVFLDRIFNIDNNYINRDKLHDSRIYSLSDYGHYLFLFKLSMHFTRINDKIERRSVLKTG